MAYDGLDIGGTTSAPSDGGQPSRRSMYQPSRPGDGGSGHGTGTVARPEARNGSPGEGSDRLVGRERRICRNRRDECRDPDAASHVRGPRTEAERRPVYPRRGSSVRARPGRPVIVQTMTQHVRERTTTQAETLEPPRIEGISGTEREITAFIREFVDDVGADGAVVNLSGGIDSTVTATLATEALGSENVHGLILPADANTDENIYDAHRVAEELVIDYHVIDIQPLLDQFTRVLAGETRDGENDPMRESTRMITSSVRQRENYKAALGNVAARIRMMTAYFEANTTSRIVLGTGNRTELLLGYFTKYGDGGVDVLPIGDLYKTEVRELARHLDVRDAVVEKEPTAGLWEGQADEAELGAAYETIDAILYQLIEEGNSVQETADAADVDVELVRTYAAMYERTAHKRTPPPTPSDHASDTPRP